MLICLMQVNILINLSDGETFQLDLNLAHAIVPGRSSKKVLKTKVSPVV